MAYTTINKSSEYFDTKIYTGNGSSQTLDMDNLGLLWMKNRTEASNHNLFDVVRGGYYTSDPGPNLRPNGNTAGHGSDITSAYGITFGSSSSTIGSDGGGYNYNQNGKSYVGWQWRANGTGSTNTDGSITSTVSANTTAGFSIVKYTGTGSNATVGHGLGSVPKVMFVKRISTSSDWTCYFEALGNTKRAILNSSAVPDTASTFWNSTTPTSSVFSVGTSGGTNASSETYIAYCFAEKQGFSKFGSFVGNGNDDGTFVYTGFKPSFILLKNTDIAASWLINDNKRPGYNANSQTLVPNNSEVENTGTDRTDFLSNGFKLRVGASTAWNGSGNNIIYMAFAEEPLVGDNPATAR